MAYCRFSTDDFRCDLYVYESCADDFVIHVAGRRRVYHRPLPPELPWPREGATRAEVRRWSWKWLARDRAMRKIGRHYKPIGGPHDGATFREPTIAAAIARLEELRAAGYLFPAEVIDELRAEFLAQQAGE